MSYNKQDIHPGFLKTRKETEDWLDMMGIHRYTIKDNLTVDVSATVWLSVKNLDYIPIQFGMVSGGFYCHNNNLNSLKGCPTKVGWGFSCENNNLTSLEYGPIGVGGSFDCSNNNLTSLKHCPTTKVDGNFFFKDNNITSLEIFHIEVSGSFTCEKNMIVTSILRGYYYGKYNPSWETDDPELISSRFFDKLEVLDSDTKIRVLTDLKKLEPEFYNSVPFQAYKPDSMLGCIQRSREATGGLFEL